MTTLLGIGAIDTTNELSLHMLGMHGTAYANYAVEDCDFLFAVGSRFDDRVAGKVKEFAPGAKIAHLDIDASEIGKVKNVDWAHVADAKRGLQQLLEAGAELQEGLRAAGAQHVAALKQQHALNYNRESPIDPVRVRARAAERDHARRGDRHAPASASIRCGRRSTSTSSIRAPSSPRAAWARWASACRRRSARSSPIPGKLVIDVDGDGSIRMNLGELETLTTYDIPVKVLLLNNLGDGMVRQWQDLFYANRYSGTDKTLHKKDFVKAAEADGFGFARRVIAAAPRCARRSRRSSRFDGPGVPRGDGRPDRARLPDGRSRAWATRT